MKQVLVPAVCLVMMLSHCTALPATSLVTCQLGGERYSVGETWIPPEFSKDSLSCVNCTCLENGRVNCTGVDCPTPDCPTPIFTRGHCCPACHVEEDDEEEEAVPGCDHDGDHYDDGDRFSSNRTALKPLSDNQCVMCQCFKGMVICHLKTCLPNPNCGRLVRVEDDCCLACEDTLEGEADRDIEFSPVVSSPLKTLNDTFEEGDCISPTGRRKNGSMWAPLVGQAWEFRCIECSCLDGNIDCARLACPTEASLSCARPVMRPDGCCKECPVRDVKKDKRVKNKKVKKGKRNRCRNKNGKKRKNCKRKKKGDKNKKRHDKPSNRKSLFPLTTPLNDVMGRLCIPPSVDRLVYFLKGHKSDSLVFENMKDKTMEHIQWVIKKGRIKKTNRKWVLAPVDFRRRVTIGDIVGGVQKRDIKRFLRRFAKRENRCKKGCRRKMIEREVRKIKAKVIDFSKTCSV